MSATASAPAPAPTGGTRAVVGTPAPAPAQHAPGQSPTSYLEEDVPRLLNRLQIVAVSVCVVWAIVTATLLALSWNANRAAADNTEQLVRVQGIQTTLLRADALATNAFLVGGIEPAEQRQAFDDSIDDVTRAIAEAAEAQPADREALETLNQLVNDYTSGIAQARDNNRQGFPVGAGYLRKASTDLRADAIPVLRALTRANSERADDELGSQHTAWVFLTGVAALIVLWVVNRQLARRFRRSLNAGLVVAFLLIGFVTLVATADVRSRSNGNDDLRSGDFATAVDEATARTAANDAKANEALALISQGSGQAFEDAYDRAVAVVEDKASLRTAFLFQQFTAVHDKIVTVQAQSFDQAVALATTSKANGSTAALDRFDQASGAVVQESASSTTDQLRGANWIALALAGLAVLLGLAAAGSSVRGISARRREYS